ncbi:MAG: carboxypeptidase regulatory-like domain-containing protein, partial [Bryobacteraceae bacterium]
MWIVIALFIPLPAFSQADVATAILKGSVTDPTMAGVPGATVTVTDLDHGVVRTAAADDSGNYQFLFLPPGVYEIRASKPSFKTAVVSRVELTVGEIHEELVQLSLGPVEETIVVTETGSPVEAERTQQANTVERRQIANLPNLSRSFTSYVFTLPGVVDSTAPRAQQPGFTFESSGFSIGGSNGRTNLITVDGGENEFGSGSTRFPVSIEAVQEYQVNRNAFAAEFGFTAGTAVNVVTRGGTNQLHGSVYAFYRSQKTSARNFFDRSTKAFDQQFYPGVTLGGPLVRNKLFFFTAWEMAKADASRFRRYTDNQALLQPSAAQQSYLAQLASADDLDVRRVGTALTGALTASNFPDTMRLLRGNEGAFSAPTRTHAWMTRVDAYRGNSDSFNLRFSLFRSDYWDLPFTNARAPGNTYEVAKRDYTILGTWTHSLSPVLHNQLRIQAAPHDATTTKAREPGSTTLEIAGVGNFGRHFGTPFNTFQDRFQFEDTVSWVRGRHLVKAGGSYRPVRYRVINEIWFGGQWSFASGIFPLITAVPAADQRALVTFNLAQSLPANGPAEAGLTALQSFNFGLPYLFRQSFNNPEWTGWTHFLGTFIQDSWKVLPRLTIDFGMRFDFDREPSPLGTYKNVAPRFGFAWDLGGDRKTVIRGGGGLFYSPVYYQVSYVTNLLDDSGRYINQVFRTPLSAQSPALLWARGRGKLPSQALTEPDLRAAGVEIGPRSPGRVIFAASPDYKNNYSAQASFGLSRQLVSNLVLEAAWQMYRGVHIQVPHEENYREAGRDVGPGLGPLLVPIDPTITQKNVYSSIGNSIYHGLTASLRRQFSRHAMFQVNYTFSKCLDDVTDFGSAFSAFLPTRLNLERGISTFDIRHSFVANGVFTSPFQAGAGAHLLSRAFSNITFSPVVSLRSGIPFTLRIGRDINGDTHADYDRPFAAPRNSGLGEKFFSLDFRLVKQIYVKGEGRLRADLIAETTNLFNHTNFLAVNDVIGTDPRFL